MTTQNYYINQWWTETNIVICTDVIRMEWDTSGVLQHSLHGRLPVRVPADLGWASAFTVLRPPALPQVHLVVVVHQEQGCTQEKIQDTQTSLTVQPTFLRGNFTNTNYWTNKLFVYSFFFALWSWEKPSRLILCAVEFFWVKSLLNCFSEKQS